MTSSYREFSRTVNCHRPNDDDVYLRGGKSDHDHESSSDFIKTTRLRHQMKQRALDELASINVIYEEELAKASLSMSALAAFPTNQEICEWTQKYRPYLLRYVNGPESVVYTYYS